MERVCTWFVEVALADGPARVAVDFPADAPEGHAVALRHRLTDCAGARLDMYPRYSLAALTPEAFGRGLEVPGLQEAA